MQLRQFGSTALKIAPLGLGTVNFSWLTNEADSFAVLDRAFEAGINLIDTSDNYNAGQTESLLGRWFAQGAGRREKTVLATNSVNRNKRSLTLDLRSGDGKALFLRLSRART